MVTSETGIVGTILTIGGASANLAVHFSCLEIGNCLFTDTDFCFEEFSFFHDFQFLRVCINGETSLDVYVPNAITRMVCIFLKTEDLSPRVDYLRGVCSFLIIPGC